MSPHRTHQIAAYTDDVIARLEGCPMFVNFRDGLNAAMGITLALRSIQSLRSTPQCVKPSRSFCALIPVSNVTCGACLEAQAKMFAGIVARPSTHRCRAGVNVTLAPLFVGGRIAGVLDAGWTLFQSPTEISVRAIALELVGANSHVDSRPLAAILGTTAVLSKSRIEGIHQLLAVFAPCLSQVGNELMLQATATEPPAVAKASAFIADHLGEVLTLPRIARAAHMSASHFSNVFKAARGITLTDYIARARVEKARTLLANPSVRVSEAGFESGFRSLSQFNRVFRRVTGEAPSLYRKHRLTRAEIGQNHGRLTLAA